MADTKAQAAQKFPHVMRSKYNDPLKLQSSLNEICGEGNYEVKVKWNRYILLLPHQMKETDMAKLEEKVRLHYRN
nr:uncharacterized protein CTRU02_03082 [Colletotrichum truncatum]KAF6798040.1 hypothetical protein CTRU02_03082 [Colletotrichum truncatum]